MTAIIDISQTLRPGIAVWPGDTRFERFWVMRMERGDSCNVGSVEMSLHTGTHTDAPLHFLRDGTPISACDLSVYMGKARVVDTSGASRIETDHLSLLGRTSPERVLFKTGSAVCGSFNPEFACFTPDAARRLAGMNIRLVGIDTPSVDKSDSETFDAHTIFMQAGIAILENLNLAHVDPGVYELIALPLKLEGMDASPVRAVLLRD